MAKRKTEILALFQESYEMTRDLPDELFGKLMKAVCQYRFTGELTEIAEPEVRMALRFVISQVDRYGDFCQQKREAAKERYNRQKEAAVQGTAQAEEESQYHEAEVLQRAAESCTEATETEENIQQQPQREEEVLQKGAKDPSISMSVSNSMSKSISDSMSRSESMSDSMSVSEYINYIKNKREAAAAAPPHTQFIPPEVSEVEAYCKKAGIQIDARRFVDYYTSVGWMVGSCPIRDWKAVVRNWSAKERNKPSSVELPPDWTIGHVL